MVENSGILVCGVVEYTSTKSSGILFCLIVKNSGICVCVEW